MTSSKKRVVLAVSMLGLALLTIIAIPLALRGPVATRLRAELDRTVDADVSWGGIDVALLRTFPNLTLGLRDLHVVGHAPFEGDTLAAMRRMRISLDLGSVVDGLRGRGPLLVRSVRLEEPFLHLRVLEDGSASWQVLGDGGGGGDAPDAEVATERDARDGRALAVELQRLEISDGRVVLDNAPARLFASLEGLEHELGGDFSRDSLVARTRTTADRTTLTFAGTSYLPGVALAFDADLAVHTADGRVAFRDNVLRLNELVLHFAGEVARVGDDLALDVRFEAPETEFRQILSLVPAVYAHDFEALETAGRFAIDGGARGRYGPAAFPALSLRATVDDGSFRHPDLPLPARAISADLSIENPGGDVDSTVVDLSRFHVQIGDQPLEGALTLRSPVSDPDVDVRVHGTLDLSALARTVVLEGVDDLTGVLTADASARARRSDLDSARYERMDARGTVTARGVTLRSPELRQPVEVEEAAIVLASERADLTTFRARLGSSDIEATGGIDNLLGFAMREEPLRATGTFHSRRFVLDEWKSDDDLEAIPVPAMLDLELDGTFDRLVYGVLDMSEARGRLRVRDQRLTLDDFSFATLGGRIGMSGHYETTDPTRPTFGLDVAIDSVDVAGASEAFLTVRALAPVARYARGTFSADLDLAGALGRDMTPVLDVLDGEGSLQTSRIAIEGFPMLDRLGEALRLSALGHPTVDAVRSNIRIQGGRLHVDPFRVGLAGVGMTVEGSNGIDQSLDYTLGLDVPRGVLGDAADRVLQDLAGRMGRAGLASTAGETVAVDVRVRGTVADPALDLGLGERAASTRALAEEAAGAAVDRQVEEARERLDEAREEARQRAEARADSIVAEAERQAEGIRAEARRLADEVRAEGDRRADEVLARATNPLARQAAQPLADRIRREADERAAGMEREADERADALVEEARRRAEAVRASGGGGG